VIRTVEQGNERSSTVKDLRVLAPKTLGGPQQIFSLAPLSVFDPLILCFIQRLSACLLKGSTYKHLPELVALGFWLRGANINNMVVKDTGVINKALGTVIHFTPANVDTMFVYSWVCSMLMGNNNIVRVASAESHAKDVLLELLDRLMSQAEHTDIAKRNAFVTYAKASDCSAVLSLQADARIIWGGDDSVNAIRALPCKPRCRDITFADRYSAALINGGELDSQNKITKLASLLWKDTQPHGQQACSSPRVVFWLGDTGLQRPLFEQVDALATKKAIPVNQLNNHLVTSQLLQSEGAAARPLVQNGICALPVSSLNEKMLAWHSGSGLFLVYQIDSVEQLAALVDDKLQTLSYWQIEKNSLLKLAQTPSIKSIDRIVPLGQALDFSTDWDGYELLSQLSRKIQVL
jgi:hypothetical protein